jgi:hypothetical protein
MNGYAALTGLLDCQHGGSPVFARSRVINDSFYNAMLWLNPNGISALLDNIYSGNVCASVELLTNRLVYFLLILALFVLC